MRLNPKVHNAACNIVPAGIEVRKMVIWLLITRGVLYMIGLPGSIAVLPYGRLSSFSVALWVYGMLCLFHALLLIMTTHNRTAWIGRMAATVTAAFCTFMAVGASGSYVQMSTYVIMAMCMIREAATNAKDVNTNDCG